MNKKNFQHDPEWAKSLPSMKEMIKSFGIESIKWLRQGAPIVDAEEYERRLNICGACPKLNQQSTRCGVCGCNMQFKARMKTAKCPESKWQEEEKK